MAKLPQDTIFHYHSDDGITVKIDAIPLVRCKDCVWRHDDSSPIWLPCMSKDTDDDWFCADGERRTE